MMTFLTSLLGASSVIGRAIAYTVGKRAMNSVSTSGDSDDSNIMTLLIIAGICIFVYYVFFKKNKKD